MAKQPSVRPVPPVKPIPLAKDGRFAILRVAEGDLAALKKHVFQRYPHREWGTFLRLGYRRTPWGLHLSFADALWPAAGDLERQSGMTVFKEQYTRRAFHAASGGDGMAIGVVHSHPQGFGTWPSLLDDDMDTYFSAELTAFGKGAPYCSFILQESEPVGLTFSGRVFDRGEWLSLRWLLATGKTATRIFSQTERNPGHSNPEVDKRESTTARLDSLFGERAAERLRGSVVGIIGNSGTGSPAAEVLARAGVGEFVLVDPQRFGRSNLERMHGSNFADAEGAPPLPYKVDLIRRMLREINPAVRVTTFVGNILHDNVVDELLRCDVLLGTTDSFHGRAALSDLSSHYLLPSIDVGVLMDGEKGKVTTQLVEFNRYSPELPCAFCSGLIDGASMSEELMTEAEREERRRAAMAAKARGDDADQYWKGRPRQLNTVGYLTTAAGGLAAGYVEGMLTGAFEMPHDRFQFDIGQPRLAAVVPARERHPECSCGTRIGWATQASSYRSVLLPPHWQKRAILTAKP